MHFFPYLFSRETTPFKLRLCILAFESLRLRDILSNRPFGIYVLVDIPSLQNSRLHKSNCSSLQESEGLNFDIDSCATHTTHGSCHKPIGAVRICLSGVAHPSTAPLEPPQALQWRRRGA